MSKTIDAIKIPQEDELRELLHSHRFFREKIEPAFGVAPQASYEALVMQALRSSAEITERSHAPLFGLFRRAVQRLEMSVTVRVFKTRDPGGTENAYISSFDEYAVVLFANSILSSLGDESALLSVIGHEFGHHGFRHTHDPAVHAVLQAEETVAAWTNGAIQFGPSDAAQLKKLASDPLFEEVRIIAAQLSQVQELNADRAGLLCAGSLEASVRGSMVLSGGPADSFGDYDPNAYLAQAKELLSTESDWMMEDVFRTHPLEPLRVHALKYFADSDVYRDITGTGPGNTKLKEFWKLLPRIVPLKIAGDEGESGKRAETTGFTAEQFALFQLLCLHQIVSADGKITDGERRFVAQQIRPVALRDLTFRAYDSMKPAERDAELRKMLTVAQGLHPKTKGSLIRLMIKAAKADRRVQEEEIAETRRLADAMGASNLAKTQIENVWGKRG